MRPSLSLRPPRDDEDVRRFPVFWIEPKRALWRVVRDGYGPWWFGCSGQGRFDLPAPVGTCYLASDALEAILECVGPGLLPGGLVPRWLLRSRHLRRLSAPQRFRTANCLVRRAVQWVTAEISTVTPYAVPQAWARALHAAGFEGVRYAPRHGTGRRAYATALFGPAGERTRWPRGAAVLIDDALLERLSTRCGITVFDTPHADELVFAPDPE